MKMTRSNKNSTVLGAVRAVVIGAVCGAVLCAGLLALFAFGFVKASYIPQFAINPIIIAVSAFSAFAAGFFAAKVSKKNGLLFGAISGRVPGILPVRMQDFLHGCQPEVRKRQSLRFHIAKGTFFAAGPART